MKQRKILWALTYNGKMVTDPNLDICLFSTKRTAEFMAKSRPYCSVEKVYVTIELVKGK